MSQYDPAPSNNHERNSHVSHGYVQIDLGPKHLLNECASTTDHSEHAFLHLVEADALPISVDEIEFGYRSGDNKVHPKIPSFYGTIDFEGGGRLVTEFADVSKEEVEVGVQMRMVFRIKAVDEMRGFTKYFWKAVPA